VSLLQVQVAIFHNIEARPIFRMSRILKALT
jgi:hypothetical protein